MVGHNFCGPCFILVHYQVGWSCAYGGVASCFHLAYVAKMTSQTYMLAKQLGEVLSQLNLKITTAESCTGGGLSAAITAIPGSSAWFDAAFVTYSNVMKRNLLNVPENLLQSHGAVSEQVAEAMLQGALKCAGADVGAAVTGIAGPSGATDTKPVGSVYISYGTADDFRTQLYCFEGNRESVRAQSIEAALRLTIGLCREKV